MYNDAGESMQATVKKPWLIIKNDQFTTVKDFFDFYHISQKKRNRMIQNKTFLVNGKVCLEKDCLSPKDRISILVFDDEKPIETIGEISCDVLYEDDFVLIANKPAGIIIHSDDPEQDTLNRRVAHYYASTFQSCSVRHLHRLDEMTSGCVIYSKCEFFQPFLDALLSEKKIRREYVAVTEGLIKQERFTIDAPIGKDRHHNQRQRISKTGKPAKTDIQVLKKSKKHKTTLIHCQLHTGRTHQIRVHLASAGYPLLSDDLYGKKSTLIQRMALHALKLTWVDPVVLKNKTVFCDIPQEILNCVEGFEIQGSPIWNEK